MTETTEPTPRNVEASGSILKPQAPIAHTAMWAAILAVAGGIPFSIIIGGTSSFPVSLGLIGVTAVAIGPASGMIAVLVGRTINIFFTPYTTTSILGVIWESLSCLGCGLLIQEKMRIRVIGYLMGVVSYAFQAGVYLVTPLGYTLEGVPRILDIWIPGSTSALPALLLALLAFTPYLRDFLRSTNPIKLIIGLAVVTFFPTSIQHMIGWGVFTLQTLLPLDTSIYVALYITWFERMFLVVVGVIIGTAVIYALRALGLQKPRLAVY